MRDGGVASRFLLVVEASVYRIEKVFRFMVLVIGVKVRFVSMIIYVGYCIISEGKNL